MIFVKNIFQLDSISSSKTTSGNSNSSSSSTKLRKETLFIYFELKKLNKLSIIQVLVKSQKKTKTWNQSPNHTLLGSLLTYLNSTCKDTTLTAVFVCSRSAQMFHSLLQSHQSGKHSVCWADLTSCARQQLDQNDLKGTCHSWRGRRSPMELRSRNGEDLLNFEDSGDPGLAGEGWEVLDGGGQQRPAQCQGSCV